MAANGFSKLLPKKIFQRFISQIGIVLKGKGTIKEESEDHSGAGGSLEPVGASS
jgi:hypothetical protein